MPVTIAIPFYNAEQYLADAIRSVFAQTYQQWELILIDDGSTDGSLDIARRINDPRVRVYSDGLNLKLAARLNQITQLASYEYIARMDADDLMSPTRIEKQLQILENHPDIDLVTTGLYSVDDSLKLLGYRYPNKTFITHKELLRQNIVVHAAMMGRKSWYLRNPYNTNLTIAQDYNLWLESSKKNDFKIFFICEPLYYYRETQNIKLSKMMVSSKYNRIFFRKYAEKDYFMLIIVSYFKDFLTILLFIFGAEKMLLKRRNRRRINPEIATIFNNEIETIKNTHIKGLD